MLVVANLSGRRYRRYRVGVPVSGRWQTLLSSDAARYGGDDRMPGRLSTDNRKAHGHPQSLAFDLPPLTAVVLAPLKSK